MEQQERGPQRKQDVRLDQQGDGQHTEGEPQARADADTDIRQVGLEQRAVDVMRERHVLRQEPRQRRIVEAQPLPDHERQRAGKADPDHPVADDGQPAVLPLREERLRQDRERERKTLVIHPLLAHQDIEPEKAEEEAADQQAPGDRRLQPLPQRDVAVHEIAQPSQAEHAVRPHDGKVALVRPERACIPLVRHLAPRIDALDGLDVQKLDILDRESALPRQPHVQRQPALQVLRDRHRTHADARQAARQAEGRPGFLGVQQ